MADVTLRGFEAIMAKRAKRRGNGSQRASSPRGPVNAAHRVLVAVGKPLHINDLVAHMIGLGYWASDSQQPTNTVVGRLNADAKLPTGVLTKPTDGVQVYGVRDGAKAPMQPTEKDVPLPGYVAAVKSGDLPDITKKK